MSSPESHGHTPGDDPETRKPHRHLWRWTRWTVHDVLRRGPRATRKAVPRGMRAVVLARDGDSCLRCGSDGALHMDHAWPWSWGGPTVHVNLQPLCEPCNREKGNHWGECYQGCRTWFRRRHRR